jgi:prepilin peptidase CpaA
MSQTLFLSFPALMTFAGSYDLFSRTIGNWLCIAIALAFLPAAAMAGFGAGEIALHLSCGLAMLCAGAALFAMGWIGGGDAKLFAAAAVWFGWSHITDYAVISALTGGVLALAVLLSRSAVVYMPHLAGLAPQKPELPYGVALALGALAAYPQSPWAAVLIR